MWAILATFGNICYAKIATKRVGVLSSWKCNKRVTMTNKVRIAHISASSYNTYCILCVYYRFTILITLAYIYCKLYSFSAFFATI